MFFRLEDRSLLVVEMNSLLTFLGETEGGICFEAVREEGRRLGLRRGWPVNKQRESLLNILKEEYISG